MKKTFKVKGMHCPSCEMLVKDSLEDEEGINNAELSHKKGTAMVDFDDSKIDENKIKSIIKDEGYEVM